VSVTPEVLRSFAACATSLDEGDLVRGALCLPLIEYRDLDGQPVLRALTRLGALATARLEKLGPRPSPQAQVELLNTLLFEEEGFRGNGAHADDPRNSFLDQVVARRTGLPIALAVVYLDVARRAGIPIEGVNFPGHFLVRYRTSAHHPEHPRDLVVDPFHGGALLNEHDLRALLQRHAGEDATYDRRLLAPASRPQILARMVTNLKRLYVSMRSFPQARAATDLLLALDPISLTELRDRGLLSYHLRDFAAALRDLEAFLQASSRAGVPAEDEKEEVQQIWEHVKTLRRRVAGFN
jgi:regulator of sirC expression with transglutaminase-like and TPR domain